MTAAAPCGNEVVVVSPGEMPPGLSRGTSAGRFGSQRPSWLRRMRAISASASRFSVAARTLFGRALDRMVRGPAFSFSTEFAVQAPP